MSRTRPILEPRSTARTLGIATLLLASVGCAASSAEVSQAPGSSRPQASASASAQATASPTPTPSPASSEAPPSASAPSGRADIAEVVTTDLVMRSAPGVGPDSEIYSPSLSAPMLLYILDGPVAADGYEWYRVARFREFVDDIGLPGPDVGWVAASGKDGEAWIAPWTGTCPAPALLELMGRSPFVALACFGDRDIAFEGTFRDCVDAGPGVSPSWLLFGGCLLVPFGHLGQLIPGFAFHQESTSQEFQGVAVRVTGHYDDPAAQTCALTGTVATGYEDYPPDLIVLMCRSSFVATEITPTSAP